MTIIKLKVIFYKAAVSYYNAYWTNQNNMNGRDKKIKNDKKVLGR